MIPAALACLLASASGIAAPPPPASPPAAGAPPAPSVRLVRERPGFDERPGELELLVDRIAWSRLWRSGHGTVERFPLPGGQSVELVLRPFEVLAPDATIVAAGPQGVRERPPPRVRFLRGAVGRAPGSLVVLGLFGDGRIAGIIHWSGEAWAFGPAGPPGGTEPTDVPAIRVVRSDAEAGRAVCDVGGVPSPSPPGSPISLTTVATAAGFVPVTPSGGDVLSLRLAIESTTEWCAHFGDDTSSAEQFLLNLAAQMSAIYEQEISERIEVGYLRTFCGVADPYTDGLTQLADRSQLLAELQAEWTANLLPATQATPRTFEVRLTAHELGHNHSSPHTNCLQDPAGQWLTRCAVGSCGINPWCQETGCYPGPAVGSDTGTIMSTGCESSVDPPTFEDTTVEPILRGAAEAAACIEATGLPGALRQQDGSELRLGRPLAGEVWLEWGAPCNAATVPGQDFAVYRGTIGEFDDLVASTCTTGGETGVLVEDPAGSQFFLVVPHVSGFEGSYGMTGSGTRREPAAAPCLPRQFAGCP